MASEMYNEIKSIYDELPQIQHDWNTYATQLGRGYTKAFENHDMALKGAFENYKLHSQVQYWVLSLVCVAFAGGVAGGLMAPWVEGQAELLLQRTFIGTRSNIVTGLVQKTFDLHGSNAAANAFTPSIKSPLLYYQDMLGELGLFFTKLREDLKGFMQEAGYAENRIGTITELSYRAKIEDFKPSFEEHIGKIRKLPIIANRPTSDDMPVPDRVARSAEIAMWIGWANVRDIAYWQRKLTTSVEHRAGFMTTGSELRTLDPILSRLEDLGVADS